MSVRKNIVSYEEEQDSEKITKPFITIGHRKRKERQIKVATSRALSDSETCSETSKESKNIIIKIGSFTDSSKTSDSDNNSDSSSRNKVLCKKNKKIEKEIKLNGLVSKFNTVMLGMISHIIDYYGDSGMCGIQNIFNDIINKTPDEPIAYFLLNIYKNDDYRHNILEQNDTYFIGQSYGDVTGYDKSNIMKVIGMKKLWKRMDNDTKNFIKRSMMVLVKICEHYILTLTE